MDITLRYQQHEVAISFGFASCLAIFLREVKTMAKASKKLRGKAARALRKSRRPGVTKGSRRELRGKAASLKLLAHNEEWLGGERQRSKARR
jgi:hypothetical protein